jgi:hypothetical protein
LIHWPPGSEMVMRSLGRIGVLCLALALAVTLGLASVATAKKHRKKRQVGTQAVVQAVGPDGIHGNVSGNTKACRSQRHVKVYRVNSGPSVPSSEFVASTWTRGDGSWAIPGPMYPSEFFAVVDSKRAKRVVCSAATSNSLPWG